MSAPCFRMLLACGVSLWVIVLCVAYAPCPLPPWWTALCGIRGRISLTIFAFWQHGFNNAHMLPQCRLVSNSKGKRPSMLPSICHWSQGVDTLLHRRSKNSWCLRFTLFEEPLFLSPDFSHQLVVPLFFADMLNERKIPTLPGARGWISPVFSWCTFTHPTDS